MKPGRFLLITSIPDLHPPGLVEGGPGPGPIEVDVNPDAADELGGADPARASYNAVARENRDTEGNKSAGEAAERRGVEVEAGGGGGVDGVGGGGAERERGGLGGEVGEMELAEAWHRGGRVDPGTGGLSGHW